MFPHLRTFLAVIALLSILLAACGSGAGPTAPAATAQPTPGATAASGQRFDGVTINLITFTGPQIAEAFQRRAPDFERLSGARVSVEMVPFDQLYEAVRSDAVSGSKTYDIMVIPPQWMVDYVGLNHLEDLTARIAGDTALAWDDIAPFFRETSATYKGRIYTIPFDGDFQMVYYRTDLLEKAGLREPATWDDYLKIAATFHGQDLNGDGAPDYGSCISKKPNAQAYWMVWSVASAFLQSQGTAQGGFFDPADLTPLVNNEAFGAALDIYQQTGAYGPPDELALDVGDTRKLFIGGRCALSLDWGDIGTLALDPAASSVIDKVGAVILPGSTRVLDRATGKLVACDKTTCPYAIDGVNHAPFAAFGGWSGAINAASDARKKDAAYAFLSYMSQPAQANTDVTIGASGFNPYRTSQFTNRDLWLKAGMSQTAAGKYLGAIGVSLNSPNMVLDLRIPHNQRYQQVVLDAAIADFLAGTISKEQAMQRIHDGWQAITDELGRAGQLAAYRATLGIDQ